MQVVHERCCGLDVHKKTVVACVLGSAADGSVQRRVRTFGTMTAELLALGDWLRDLAVTQVAIESTGVYWRPVYTLIEDGRTITLVNAQHVKGLPGRKTDVQDSEWLADLLRHGLLRPSFIPPPPISDLRELTRYRKTLVQERTDEVNRLHKLLESANLKLASVASDVMGVSGRLILAALAGGQDDPEALAALAKGLLRKKLPELRRALEGRVKPVHRVLLERLLAHGAFLEESIAAVQQEIEAALRPFAEAVTLLQTIPGVGATAAATIVAELGTDMARFPSAKHLASWAGVCPGNKQSGGKRLSGKTTHGDSWLRAALGEVAWAIAHTKDTYLAACYHRLARRRGKYKAAVAIAHRVLVICYHVLKDQRPYQDLGPDYFDQLDPDRLQRHHVRRLEQLGYAVTLTKKEAA
ncbi:MAG: IS110 family transposase [Candidatus Dormibacteraeota bacterium]|nr:IS110 family transposase [Candidatus Dormibacteraeota bacterium]